MRGLIIYSLAFASLSVAAQDSKFYFGFNSAGVWNSYLFRHKDAYLLEGRPNWSLGLQSKYVVTKTVQLDAQINFASKNFGSGIDYSYYRVVDPNDPIFLSSQSHWAVRQTYLEIPISVSYFFQADKPVKIFCSTGVTNSFSLSAKYAGNPAPLNSTTDQVGERYQSYLLSFRAGGGVMFSIGKNIYGAAELYSNVYVERTSLAAKGNPFQMALGFSVLKKIVGAKTTSN